MNRKPIIISVAGKKLTKAEKFLIKNEKPWGVILFKRNIDSFDQVKNLTREIRKCLKDPFYPILIDEEGGEVSRLSSLINTGEFSQKFFGNLFEKNNKNGKLIYAYYLNSTCAVLKKLGININTIPVLDLLQNLTHKIIKERSYSRNLKTIKSLGEICIHILKSNKIGSVAKHIPGHGCVNADSHKKLPITTINSNKLYSNDFNLFKNLNSNFVMTAHVLYKKIDPKFVATQSTKIIKEIIRKKLKFKGLIISDDISMKALSSNLVLNAKLALSSGCNLVLYCNGKTNESSLLLKNLDKIDSFTEKKTRHFYQFLR
jgi:beta-N-acetylhexosaminidase